MVDRNRLRLLTGIAATLLLPALSGCTGPYREAPPPYGYPPYYYDYYYYPNVYVYFHIYTGWYYYWYDGIWWRVRELPPHIHLYPRYRVLLNIRDEYPYIHHDEHRRKFPPPPVQSPRGAAPSAPVPRQDRLPPSATQRQAPPQIPPDLKRDREEREHNLQRYEEYRKKPWLMPRR